MILHQGGRDVQAFYFEWGKIWGFKGVKGFGRLWAWYIACLIITPRYFTYNLFATKGRIPHIKIGGDQIIYRPLLYLRIPG